MCARIIPERNEPFGPVKGEMLTTICREAGCPTIHGCWEDRKASFLIAGEQCARRCDSCQIAPAIPQPLIMTGRTVRPKA